MTEPVLRQIIIGHDDVWESVVQMFGSRGLDLKRMPQFGDEEGIENYCLKPREM